MNTVTQAIELFKKTGRPFSGKLIAPPDDPSWINGCPRCAQGIILSEICRYSDDQLRQMRQSKADAEVSKALGISRTEAVLLRYVNDSDTGLPQKVLVLSDDGIGSVVGGEWRILVSFWRYLDTLTAEQRAAACTDAGSAEWAAAGTAAEAAGGADVWHVVWAAAGDAAGASYEIMGRSQLKSFFFLPAFGFATPEMIPLHSDVKE